MFGLLHLPIFVEWHRLLILQQLVAFNPPSVLSLMTVNDVDLRIWALGETAITVRCVRVVSVSRTALKLTL